MSGPRDYPCSVRYLRQPDWHTLPDVDWFEMKAWAHDARSCIRELQLRVVLLERELTTRGIVRGNADPGRGWLQRHDDPKPDSLIGPE